jgi:hypothetical protein
MGTLAEEEMAPPPVTSFAVFFLPVLFRFLDGMAAPPAGESPLLLLLPSRSVLSANSKFEESCALLLEAKKAPSLPSIGAQSRTKASNTLPAGSLNTA